MASKDDFNKDVDPSTGGISLIKKGSQYDSPDGGDRSARTWAMQGMQEATQRNSDRGSNARKLLDDINIKTAKESAASDKRTGSSKSGLGDAPFFKHTITGKE